MTPSLAKDPLIKRLLRWIFPDRRVANRLSMPPLIAYPGLVRSSNEYSVGDISVGTGFPITLERTDEAGMGQTLTLHSTVVRSGENGVAFTFVQPATEKGSENEKGAGIRSDLTKLAQFLKAIRLAEPGDAVERVI